MAHGILQTFYPMESALTFRPATLEDAEFLFRLRQEAAANYKTVVSLESTREWLRNSPEHMLLRIAQIDGEPIGTARWNLIDGEYDLSYAVLRKLSGHGVGKRMMHAFVKEFAHGKNIRAICHENNIASQQVALSLGLKHVSSDGPWKKFA